MSVIVCVSSRPQKLEAEYLQEKRETGGQGRAAKLNYAIALQQSGDRQRAIEVYRSLLANPGNYPREKQAARELLAALGAGR